MSQLSFDLACNGAALAANHADRVSPGWSERALAAFLAYAATHEEFTTEDVIEASANVPAAVEKRAWGQIALAAKRQKIIRNAGYAHSKLDHAHCRPVTRWVSLICSLDFVHLA